MLRKSRYLLLNKSQTPTCVPKFFQLLRAHCIFISSPLTHHGVLYCTLSFLIRGAFTSKKSSAEGPVSKLFLKLACSTGSWELNFALERLIFPIIYTNGGETCLAFHVITLYILPMLSVTCRYFVKERASYLQPHI